MLERWALASVVTADVPNVVDIGSSVVVVAQSAMSYAEHMLLLGRLDGGYRMAPGKRGLLLRPTSSCLGCSGGFPVCPSDEEFGKSGLESGSCSMLPHLDCSALERNRRHEREDSVLGASSGLAGHVQEWGRCSFELHQRDCVGDHNYAAWDTRQFDGGRSRQMNVLDACGGRLVSHERRARSVAIAFGWSAAAWKEIHHYQTRRSHHRPIRRNGRPVGVIGVGA